MRTHVPQGADLPSRRDSPRGYCLQIVHLEDRHRARCGLFAASGGKIRSLGRELRPAPVIAKLERQSQGPLVESGGPLDISRRNVGLFELAHVCGLGRRRDKSASQSRLESP